ncbi:mediator of replication checkpoint protein 1 [Monosporozyma servazzii]
MDALFKELGAIKPKKRTTYKKVTDSNENDLETNKEPPLVDNLEGGFLFENPTLKKVKERLDHHDNEDLDSQIQNKSDHTSNIENDEDGNHTFQLSQTQLLKSMYGGGEDLESIEQKRQEERRKKEAKELKQKRREAKRKQREEAKKEHDLLEATQVIYQKHDLRTRNRYRHPNRPINTSRTIEETFQEMEREAEKSEMALNNIEKEFDDNDIPLSQSKILSLNETRKSSFDNADTETEPASTLDSSLVANAKVSKKVIPATQSTQMINTNITSTQLALSNDDLSTQKIYTIPTQGEATNNPNKISQVTQKLSEGSSVSDLKTQVFNAMDDKLSKSQDIYAGVPKISEDNIQTIPLFNFTQKARPTEVTVETQVIHEQQTQKISSKDNASHEIESTQPINQIEVTQATQIISNTQATQIVSTTPPSQVTQPTQVTQVTQPTQITQVTQVTQPTQVTQSIQIGTVPDRVTSSIPDGNLSDDEITATLADNAGPTLKIHEIQNQLQLEEEEKFNNGNKEYQKEQKAIPSKILFTKDSFLANFDSDSSDSEEETLKNTPTDAPIESKPNNEETDSNMKSNPPKRLGGLTVYETNLKTQMDSKNNLELDSDDDSDLEIGNGASISHVAKATILNIKARLSKKRPQVKSNDNNKGNLGTLFENLRKKSRQQILERQSELMESKGINKKDLEKEKEIVENLLEQEILRNQNIRQREKQREKQQEAEGDLDFDYSANELEESDFIETDEEETKNDEEVTYQQVQSDNEENKAENKEKDEGNDDEDEEEFSLIKPKKSRNVHVTVESDSESDSDVEAKQSPRSDKPTRELGIEKPPNAIFLGHYGDNLDKSASNIVAEGSSLIDKEDADEDKLDEAKRKAMIDEQKYQQRLKEKKLKEKKKQLKGLTNFVEEEAEESEDEWHGIGGADGEDSDEYDSEIEKMIDDYSKSDLNPEDIRKLLVEENRDMDMKMVNKILYDIKNGNFRKRGRSALELEISDDEDDDLRNYRLRRKEMMKQRLLDIGDDKKLIKNPKSKAFFDSLVEDIIEMKSPFEDMEEPEQSLSGDDETSETEAKEKDGSNLQPSQHKKIVLSEDFVQKSLSFLNSNRDLEEYERNKEMAYLQHGEDVEDLFTLKQNSSIKSFRSLTKTHETITLDDENSGADFSTSSKHPSIIQSFNSKTDINDKFKEGNKTVKISKSYKTVGSSKASITYMSKVRKLMAPKHKKKHNLAREVNQNKKSRASKLFSNESNSFGR